MGNKLCLFIILSLCLFGGLAVAQDKAPDPGIPDTVSVVSTTVPEGTLYVGMDVVLYNDEEVGGFALPFTWDSPDLACDSITFHGSRIAYVSTKPTQIDNVNRKLQVGMVIIFEPNLQPGSGDLFTLHFSIAPGAASQVVTFDSTSYSAASPFILTLPSGQTFVPQYIPGTLTIGEPVQDPTIGLSTDVLNFTGVAGGSNPVSQMFSVSNTGDGTLNWTASTADSWISVNPGSGTDAGDVTVGVDINTLAAGDYVGTVTVSDPAATNNPQSVTVNLHLDPPPPCLSLSATTLNFSGLVGEVKSLPLTITNCGGQTLNWTVTGIDAGWLSVDMVSGATATSQEINFMANLAGLAAGNYSDVVNIAGAAGTENSPQDVTINVVVIDTTPEADTVWVGSAMVTAGNQVVVDINYQNFVTIGAIDALPLQFSGDDIVCDSVSYVGSRVDYFEINESVIDNAAQTIVVAAFPIAEPKLAPGSGLLARLYFSVAPEAATQASLIDTITFVAPVHTYLFLDENGAERSTEFFTGSIAIEGLPCFDFPVDSVVFAGNVNGTILPQSFSVANTCYGDLHITSISDNAAWLTVPSLPHPSQPLGPFEFAVNTAGLSEGDYFAEVTFESNALNSPVTIPVRMTLVAVPELAVSQTSFNFGTVCQGNVVSDEFTITNIGTGTLDWTADAIEAISLSAYSGSAPATVSFEVNTAELGFGPQTWTIEVAAAGAIGSPKVISLTMNIANCDECTFDIADLEGMQGLPVAVPISAFQVSDIGGLEFHMEFDGAVLAIDSITSSYLAGPTVGIIENPINEIHYIWSLVNLAEPVTVPDGEPIITLWFTPIGDIGEIAPITWMEGNEIVDPFGQEILGIGYCNGSVTVIPPTFDVFGRITYYDMTGQAIEGVTVEAAGPDMVSVLTDATGNYRFEDIHVGSYVITPSRSDDDSGVSVADIILIQRHLAYIERFDSPYEMIAGDVNLSADVSIADVVVIRRYLDQLDILPSGNWTFVVWDYGINMTNWPISQRSINVNLTSYDIGNQSFYAIRLGDVNASWFPMLFAKPTQLAGDKVTIGYGEIGIDNRVVTVPVTISSVDDMAGMELHLAYSAETLTFTGIHSDILSNVTFNGGNGEIHMVWDNLTSPIALSGNRTIAALTFIVNDPEIAGEITTTGAELVNAEGRTYPIDISAKGEIGGNSTLPFAYALEQNSPNPFNPTTTIRATMSEPGEYELAVYNVMGQKIRTYQGYHEAGTLEFVWDGNDDNGVRMSSGIYLYKFSAGQFSDTKKMVLLK